MSLITTSSLAFSPGAHPIHSSINKFRRLSLVPMVKRSERAFIEKRLEDAMNNDWRVFRARLVAQEHIEASSSKVDPVAPVSKEEKTYRHGGDIGDMFADAISSIFSRREKDHGTSTGQPDKIFHGDTIGGASVPNDLLNCEDPFVSREELPILLSSKVSIDKDRWAHTIPHIEPGCVLVANEKLGGVFHQTVVLIIDHSESQGSNGIIINR
jgi:putative transcriptional regulator